jgi:hypothetical protein
MKKKLLSSLLGVFVSCFVLANAYAGGIPAGFVEPANQPGKYIIVFINFNNQYTQAEVEGYVKGQHSVLGQTILKDSVFDDDSVFDYDNASEQNMVIFGPSDLAPFGDADVIHAALTAHADSANPTFKYLYMQASKVQFNGKTNLRFDMYIYNKNVPNGQYVMSLEILGDLVSTLGLF